MLQHLFGTRPWFAAKRFGVGAGLPIAWQGWMLLVAHISLIAGVTVALIEHPAALVITAMAVALLPIPVYARHTRGGWRWRWGDD